MNLLIHSQAEKNQLHLGVTYENSISSNIFPISTFFLKNDKVSLHL